MGEDMPKTRIEIGLFKPLKAERLRAVKLIINDPELAKELTLEQLKRFAKLGIDECAALLQELRCNQQLQKRHPTCMTELRDTLDTYKSNTI